jgi:hypothetical protein
MHAAVSEFKRGNSKNKLKRRIQMKHSLLLLTAVFAVFAFFVACGGSEGSGDGGSGGIYGHVTDFATGEDVIHAKVSLSPGGNTTLTGSDGIYEFRDLKSGGYTIAVSKDGYNEFESHYVDVYDKMVVYDISLVKYKACEKQPCGSHGTCVAESDSKYRCTCDDGYFNTSGNSDGSYGECINPCDPNPCGNGICTAKNYEDYDCICDVGYWDGSQCDEFPLCENTNTQPCKAEGYVWSSRAPQDMDWYSAMAYCDNLSEGGYDDWSLPSIEVLANFYNGYGSSKLGDTGGFWSSTPYGDGDAYLFYFSNGDVYYDYKSSSFSVRCVRW